MGTAVDFCPPKRRRLHLDRKDAVIEIQGSSDDSDSDDDSLEETAGGFFKVAAAALPSAAPAQETSATENGEVEDYALAKALQEEEDAAAAAAQNASVSGEQTNGDSLHARGFEAQLLRPAIGESSKSYSGGVAREDGIQGGEIQHFSGLGMHSAAAMMQGTRATSEQQSISPRHSAPPAPAADTSSDEENDVDWEDGASATDDIGAAANTMVSKPSADATADDEGTTSVGDQIDWEDGESNMKHDRAHTYSDEENDVDWEDGASATDDVDAAANTMVSKPSADATADDGETTSVADQIDWEDGESNTEHDAAHTYSDGMGDFDGTSDDFAPTVRAATRPVARALPNANDPMSPETSAALQQAQATAANLTNWAGRAFRRAMAEAGASNTTNHSVPEAGNSSEPQGGMGTESGAEAAAAAFRPEGPNGSAPPQSDRASAASGNVESTDVPNSGNEGTASLPSSGNHRAAGQPPSVPVTFDAHALDPSVLQANEEEWASERNRRERDMDTISDEMLEEAKQLLQLFGVPYIEAPAEAEAQCAALEALGLVDGIVTEDSDVFAFGGRTGK